MTMLKKIQKMNGFTMMEMMVTVGISSMLTFSMFHVMKVGAVQSEVADVRMTIQDSGREAIYKVVQELRMTSPTRVTFGGSCASITFNVPDPASPVNSTTKAVNWPGHQIQYAFAGTQLTRTNVTTGQTSVIANNVTSAMFTTDTTSPFTCATGASPNTVTAVLNLQRSLKNGRLIPATPLQVAAQARIRNSG